MPEVIHDMAAIQKEALSLKEKMYYVKEEISKVKHMHVLVLMDAFIILTLLFILWHSLNIYFILLFSSHDCFCII